MPKPGSRFTKKITRGKNKGDTVSFKVGPSGKPYPSRVIKDVGNNSTLKNNPGVKFGKGTSKKCPAAPWAHRPRPSECCRWAVREVME